jgi:hypothetical protein
MTHRSSDEKLPCAAITMGLCLQRDGSSDTRGLARSDAPATLQLLRDFDPRDPVPTSSEPVIDIPKQWLVEMPWASVVTLNKALCQAQKVEPAIKARTTSACASGGGGRRAAHDPA